MTGPLASVPSDNTTLTAVLDAYAGEGFDGVFQLLEDAGEVCCSTCHAVVPPEQVPIHSVRRLEGASDPADMVAVCAITCVNCSARGTIVVKFGPDASIGEAEFLSLARDQRHDAAAPPDAAPGEGPL